MLLKKFIEEGADSAARALLSLAHPLLPSFLKPAGDTGGDSAI